MEDQKLRQVSKNACEPSEYVIHRRRRVGELLGEDYSPQEIADELDVSIRTIKRDLDWMFADVNPKEERLKVRSAITWSHKQATTRYLEAVAAEEMEEARAWLGIRVQIEKVMVLFDKITDNSSIILNQTNTQINASTNVLVQLKQLQDSNLQNR